ncbi:MAG: PQQ-like beta-propeller repeat protein [Verrucomicrobia bacterium]|nr:PQQ-like beta-propeller repeat protein [Verrucomicrobiota bacterium]
MNPLPVPSSARPPLRLWPGVVIVAVQWIARFVVPAVVPESLMFGVMASLACAVALIIWWLFFSRAPWAERFGALVVAVAAVVATRLVVHPSIAGGMMGLMLAIYSVPLLSVALVAAAAIGRRLGDLSRRGMMAAALLAACAPFTALRTGGINSEADSDFHWRWTPTPEEKLLTLSPKRSPAISPASAAPVEIATWPGFRGPARDSVVRGARLATNWSASRPIELWRRSVGPGWSSFAVSGDRCYTQEQRGDDEIVACYRLSTGEPMWQHADATRFYESNAGAGPRGTPTLHAGRAYAFGATGVLNALDARTGAVVWTRNAAVDTQRKIPDWGLASSPLIIGDLVIVAVSGTLAAYDLATGAPRWTGPRDGGSYSSPHLLEIEGVPQVVLMNGTGAVGITPADGRVLWQHAWKGFAIVQPAQIANGDLLISTGDTTGARRIEVTRKAGTWSASERWTTNRLKPYFNDFVLHRGHAYGFDNGILACISLADGARQWKGDRYGRGQLLLLADQDALLVLSEQGEIALVAARPDEFAELARAPALAGKTWNHPALAGDVLLVRNDHEMAAFRLPR